MKPYYSDDSVTLHHGPALDVLATLPDESADCIVTSPPYFGLRSYLPADHPDKHREHGTEASPGEFIDGLRAVFAEARRVLAKDGTLWVNIGDSYYSGRGNPGPNADDKKQVARRGWVRPVDRPGQEWGTPKSLIGIPWRLAFALQDDGWILRNDIVWCLSGGSWVYARTQKGEAPHMLKDLVRLNPATVQLWNGERWTQVLGWGPSTDTSERIELVLRSGERIGATGGHQWPTQRGLLRTDEIKVGDIIRTTRLPEPHRSTPAFLTEDVLWLMGLYLAEGSRSQSTIQLSLNASEAPWLARIERAIQHLGGTVSHTLSGNNLSVRCWGKVADATLRQYVGGRTSRDKHLTNAAWVLSNEALRHIVSGYLDGDGHHDARNDRWRLGFTRNYALERDLRTAAARLGARVRIVPTTSDGHKIFRGEWRWHVSSHHNTKDYGEVREVRRSRGRQFFDVSVADEPHLFALASGVLTHNCKPNAMPESVTDRLAVRHEYVFMFSRSRRYWFDLDPIREPLAYPAERPQNSWARDTKEADVPGQTMRQHRADRPGKGGGTNLRPTGRQHLTPDTHGGRNPGTVWTIPTTSFPGAHYAVMTPALAERCILAGCRPGGTVLDPYSGAGTTGMVANRHGRRYVGIDLDAKALDLSLRTRLAQGALMDTAVAE